MNSVDFIPQIPAHDYNTGTPDCALMITFRVIQHLEAPKEDRALYGRELFLAGGITGCADWQKVIVDILAGEIPEECGLTVYNPRRPFFDVQDSTASDVQVDWEYARLRSSPQLLFWFAPETLCPIALFELGGALERARQGRHQLFIGVHPNYERIFDVRYQTEKMFPTEMIKVVTSLRALASQVVDFNSISSATSGY